MVATKSTDNKKKFCNLISLIKIKENNDSKLLDVIEVTCIDHLFKSKFLKAVFLYPNKKLIDKLHHIVYEDGEPTEARQLLQSLLIRQNNKENVFPTDVITFNNHRIDKFPHNDISETSWEHTNNTILVYEYKKDEFPKEGEKVEKHKSGSNEEHLSHKKIEITNKIINQAKQNNNAFFEEFGYALDSLLLFLKENHPSTYDKLLHKFDPNLVLCWYIFVQPNKTQECYIPNHIFNKWEYVPTHRSMKNIQEFLKNYTTDTALLQKQHKVRTELEKIGKAMEIIPAIKKEYNNNYLKLLEDELRFKYAKSDCINEEDVMTLNLINWDKPENSLTLFDTSTFNDLQKLELYQILNNFVKSHYLLYEPYDVKLREKIENFMKKHSIQGGSENMSFFIGGSHYLHKIQNHKNHNTDVKHIIANLSSSQKEELKKLL